MQQLARQLRSNRTIAETTLWRALRDRRLSPCKFKRQQIIAPYIVDFVCFDARLIVEIDGGQHAEQPIADETRTAFLEQQGFHVMRFWNNEVMTNLEGVLYAIECALLSASRGEASDTTKPRPAS